MFSYAFYFNGILKNYCRIFLKKIVSRNPTLKDTKQSFVISLYREIRVAENAA